MAALRDKYYLTAKGGIRLDLSDYEKDATQFVKLVNYDIDRSGLTKRRLGSHQLGNLPTSDNIENSFFWQRILSVTSEPFFLYNTDNSAGLIYKEVGSRLTTAVTTASTSVVLDDGSAFASSGTAEVEGDIFSYSGKSSNTLTGVTNLSESHAIGAAVHQWASISATAVGGPKGVSYAPLNNVIYIQIHDGGGYTWDGTTLTAVGDGDEPNSRFATTYRQRIFVIQFTSSSSCRVFFSAAGDSTSWTATDYFDVEDSRGEIGTGFRVLNDELLILKTNSFFAYNEVNLKQRSATYGAFNNKVHQEIGGFMYSFCPQGVFRTNGISVQKISDPVEQWLRDYRPVRDTTSNSIVINTFSGQFDNKYILWVGDVSTPGTYSGTTLVYDTIRRNWTVYTGLINLKHFFSTNIFNYGGGTQGMRALFAGGAAGTYFRFFSKSYIDADGNSRNTLDGDLFTDFITDAVGTPISAELQSPLLDLGVTYFKAPAFLRMLMEDLGCFVSIRYEDQRGLSDWIPVGEVTKRNQRFRLPDQIKGYRFAITITHNDKNSAPVINGFGFEEIEGYPDQR